VVQVTIFLHLLKLRYNFLQRQISSALQLT
jgi:hypothetical protein